MRGIIYDAVVEDAERKLVMPMVMLRYAHR
jgi:hypothetical protein